MTKKRYFIPLSSLNLNGVFASESVSPHSFYEKRMFGMPYNTLTDDNGTLIQSENSLVLFSDYFEFMPSSGCPIFLGIHEDDLDLTFLVKDNETNIAYYFKSIYLRKGNFFVLFPNEDEKYLFIAMATPSTEVKTLNKYNVKYAFGNNKETDILYSLSKQTTSKKRPNFPILNLTVDNNAVFFDKAFNHIKGFIYGFLCGSLGQKTDDEIDLERTFQELHNLITGIKGKIEITQSFSINDYDEFKTELNKSNSLFRLVFPNQQNFGYDNITVRLEELVKLQEKRFVELSRQKRHIEGLDKEEVRTIQKQIDELERQFYSVRGREQELRERKKMLEESRPKRPKANSPEKIERERVDGEIEEIKSKIADLKPLKYDLEQQISYLRTDLQQFSALGRTEYDNSVEEQYFRIAGYITDLSFWVSQNLTENKKGASYPQIDNVNFDLIKLTNHWQNPSNNYLDFIVSFSSPSIDNLNDFDLSLYKLCTNILLSHSKTDENNLSAKATDLAIYLLDTFTKSELSKTENGLNVIRNLTNLIDYRSSRTSDYAFPDNQILIAFICTIFKPNSIDEFTNLIQSNKVSCLDIAYSFWATFNGFANLPKNLTDIVLENGNEHLINYIDDYLFNNYLKNKNHTQHCIGKSGAEVPI
jgi:prefoldin subunit 5